ncbi:MAG TPA: hypothetical protein ENI95_11375 [Chloroflexi bacterium]|nr:hypothetical protein [Chloroflexota bacterium]
MARRQLRLHIVSHLRWDREGFETFQVRRLRLVRLLDYLLDFMDAEPDWGPLLLDGQAILLEDYLELRPERQAICTALIGEGRLQIGPWYVLPEEFLVSPEALLRNLSAGSRMADYSGGRLDIGYLPESSGHIGQMPQILRDFGIESAVAVRGVGNAPAESRWEAQDGSRVLLGYLKDGFYAASALPPDEDGFKAALARIRDSLKGQSATDDLLLMEEVDRETPLPRIITLVAAMRRRFRGTRVFFSSLPAYFAAIRERQDEFPTIAGEMRSPQRFPLFSGTLSTRIWIKQRNHAIQTLLECWAEPFGAWAALIDRLARPATEIASPARLIWHAWRILLQNHEAPSLRGTGLDQVQREVDVRFDHAEQIGEEITRQNLEHLAQQIDARRLPSARKATPLVVFNAARQPQTGVIDLDIPIPTGSRSFEIVDEAGDAQPFEVTETPGQPPGTVRLRLLAREVPALGYRTYALIPSRSGPEEALTDEGLDIENEWLSLTLDPHEGTLTLYDKRTGRSFSGLNRFVDGGDRGDTCTYCPPERDTVIDIAANTPLHAERRITPFEQTLSFLQIYRLPHRLTEDRSARQPLAAQFVPITILTTLRLVREVPRVDVHVRVDNGAYDHRLRVHFPTGVLTQEAFFDGHFEVVRRPLAIPGPGETAGWAEQPTPEKPQRAFVTVLGDETGLTLANRGLPEVAVLAGEQGAEIALTLLRCVGWLSRDDLPNREGSPAPQVETPEAQCIGTYEFEYSLIPHQADPLPAWLQAWTFQTPLKALLLPGATPGPLPLSDSLMVSETPAFVLSAVKIANDGGGLIVRGYNVSEEAITVTLRSGFPFRHAEFARLDETLIGESLVPDEEGRFTFEAGPARIVTLYLPFSGGE